MKKILLALTLVFLMIGCGKKDNVLKIAATTSPHAQILEFVKEDMAKKGITLEIIETNDFVTPNVMLNDKQIDANFFQNLPYLENFNKEKGMNLVAVKPGLIVGPKAIYSKKIKDIKNLKDGATVTYPSDPTNGGRSLILLHKAGLIVLKDPTNFAATEQDIIENLKHLKFKPLDDMLVARTLQDTDIGVCSPNFAVQAGLNPLVDGLVIEDLSTSPYANIIVVRAGDENNKNIKELIEVLTTDKVREYIKSTFKGSMVPTF